MLTGTVPLMNMHVKRDTGEKATVSIPSSCSWSPDEHRCDGRGMATWASDNEEVDKFPSLQNFADLSSQNGSCFSQKGMLNEVQEVLAAANASPEVV